MRRTVLLCVFSGLVGALVALAVCQREAPHHSQAGESAWAPRTSLPAARGGPVSVTESPGYEELTPEEQTSVVVHENVNRGVVNISTRSVGVDTLFWRETPSEGEGSGSVIDTEGHLLTNFHVIDGAREIRVTLYDSATYDAELVGADPATDVAVLKIDAPPETLHPVVFGDSSRLLVGQRVYALGSPFGLSRTFTSGIVSSLDREIPSRRRYRTIEHVIQTDAAINPGSSGGPLLDTSSRMIGMNTAIASRTGENAGVGFAIPVNTIARVIPQLIANGRVVRPDIGLSSVVQTDKGLLIARIVPGGSADQAGLKGPQLVRRRRTRGILVWEETYVDWSAADLIVGVDGQPVHAVDDLLSAIESRRPGETVSIHIVRDGRPLDVDVKLETAE